MLLHVLSRMRTIGAIRHVQVAVRVFRGLWDTTVRSEINALIKHWGSAGLIERSTNSSGIHSVHAVVILVCVESARLVLTLDEHLGCLHQARPKTWVIGAGTANTTHGSMLVVLLLVLLQKHHELLELGHWVRIGCSVLRLPKLSIVGLIYFQNNCLSYWKSKDINESWNSQTRMKGYTNWCIWIIWEQFEPLTLKWIKRINIRLLTSSAHHVAPVIVEIIGVEVAHRLRHIDLLISLVVPRNLRLRIKDTVPLHDIAVTIASVIGPSARCESTSTHHVGVVVLPILTGMLRMRVRVHVLHLRWLLLGVRG